jgi:hypothetical protein
MQGAFHALCDKNIDKKTTVPQGGTLLVFKLKP